MRTWPHLSSYAELISSWAKASQLNPVAPKFPPTVPTTTVGTGKSATPMSTGEMGRWPKPSKGNSFVTLDEKNVHTGKSNTRLPQKGKLSTEKGSKSYGSVLRSLWRGS